jgi:hypothetical protein
MTESIVFVSHGPLERPVVLVIERTFRDGRPDLQIVLRKVPEEHLSLHRQDDGGLLLTHSSPDKPPSVWDEGRVRGARALGWRDPEKHGTYYQHHRIPEGSPDGWPLVGKLIDLATVRPMKAKYERAPRIAIVAPAPLFMLRVNLTSPGQVLASEEPRIATAFGELYFRADPPMRRP